MPQYATFNKIPYTIKFLFSNGLRAIARNIVPKIKSSAAGNWT